MIYSQDQWFTKKDVENAVAINRAPSEDCANLVEACRIREQDGSGFKHRVLLYSEYTQLPDASEFDHGDSDLMAIMWQTAPQRLRAIASAQSMSWDASHDTNHLKLKYFDFATLGSYKMIELIAQGLQRHEDIVTARWILDTLKSLLQDASLIRICYIDGDWASRLAIKLECDWVTILLDEWHTNQNFSKNMKGLLGDSFHSFLAKMWTFSHDSDIRTQHHINAIIPDIINSAGMDPVKDGKKWKARARNVCTKGVKYITDLVGDVDMWARCFTHHAGVRGEHMGSGINESIHNLIKGYIGVFSHVADLLDLDTTITKRRNQERIRRAKNSHYNKAFAYTTGAPATPLWLLPSFRFARRGAPRSGVHPWHESRVRGAGWQGDAPRHAPLLTRPSFHP